MLLFKTNCNSSENCVTFLRTVFHFTKNPNIFPYISSQKWGAFQYRLVQSLQSGAEAPAIIFEENGEVFFTGSHGRKPNKSCNLTSYKLMTLQHTHSVYSCTCAYTIKMVVISYTDDILSCLSIKFQCSPATQQCRSALTDFPTGMVPECRAPGGGLLLKDFYVFGKNEFSEFTLNEQTHFILISYPRWEHVTY